MYLSGLDLCTEGLCTYRVPLYVFPPTVDSRKEEKVVNVTKILGVLSMELLTIEVGLPNDTRCD